MNCIIFINEADGIETIRCETNMQKYNNLCRVRDAGATSPVIIFNVMRNRWESFAEEYEGERVHTLVISEDKVPFEIKARMLLQGV